MATTKNKKAGKGARSKRGKAGKTKAVPPQRSKAAALHEKIEQAAYFKAEGSGFQGDPVEHWLAAEAELSENLGQRK